MKQTRQAVRAIKQSIFLDVYGLNQYLSKKKQWKYKNKELKQNDDKMENEPPILISLNFPV